MSSLKADRSLCPDPNPSGSVLPALKQELTTDFLQRGLAPSLTIAQSQRRACV
ncbi:MAG: hypothetical protein QM706_14320 [Nitrospira sp.]